MRILITGSSGQIGTNLALECLRNGHSLQGIDIRRNTWTNSFPTTLLDLAANAPELDHELSRLPIPDVLIHLAAHAKVHDLVANPRKALENTVMLFNVLEYCRRHQVPLMFASSREVYGEQCRQPRLEESVNHAQSASPYAASKLGSEALIQAYARCYQLRFLILRLSNVFGRFDNDLDRLERVVPLFVHRIERGLPLRIFGAQKVLDFTHVDDCVRAFGLGLTQLEAGRIQNETINISGGVGHKLEYVARQLGQVLRREPLISFDLSRAGEITHYVGDLTKARSLLGFTPAITLSAGLERAVQWQLAWKTEASAPVLI